MIAKQSIMTGYAIAGLFLFTGDVQPGSPVRCRTVERQVENVTYVGLAAVGQGDLSYNDVQDFWNESEATRAKFLSLPEILSQITERSWELSHSTPAELDTLTFPVFSSIHSAESEETFAILLIDASQSEVWFFNGRTCSVQIFPRERFVREWSGIVIQKKNSSGFWFAMAIISCCFLTGFFVVPCLSRARSGWSG